MGCYPRHTLCMESGIDDAVGWYPAFDGQRRPFQPGNQLAARHGAYARLQLAPRAKEIAESLHDVVPVVSSCDAATIDVLGLVLAQLERAGAALAIVQAADVDRLVAGDDLGVDRRDDLRRLAADSRGWANVALRYFDALGLTPTSRARLGLDIARARDALADLADEGRRIRAERGAGGE